MDFRILGRLAGVLAVTAGLAGSGGAFADVTVRMMHVEQNQDISGYWNDIAKRYEAVAPGLATFFRDAIRVYVAREEAP